MPPKRRNATYRFQINKDFTLDHAADLVPYLSKLGISDIYLSPILESTPGSNHGYDILDFSKISEERGGAAAFDRLHKAAAAQEPPLGILLDIVPNHMGIAGENPYWFDVLAKGETSEYWKLFDLRIGESGKIRVAALGSELSALKDEDIAIGPSERFGLVATIGGRNFPLSEETQNELRDGAKKAGHSIENYVASLGRDDVEDILSRQPYELAVWTEAFEKISYRRFFNITELVGVRVEDEKIYDLTHAFLFSLLEKYDRIGGVRVDHIDGLAEPGQYLGRLGEKVDHVLVEKILAPDEKIPASWPVDGTTGYEFVSHLNNLFVDPARFATLRQYWVDRLEPRWEDFQACVRESKEETLKLLFPSEMNRLVALSKDRGDEDEARLFFTAMTVCLKVYRTYGGNESLSAQDRTYIDRAVEDASAFYGEAFDSAARKFLPALIEPKTDIDRQILVEWQQLSGPAMAKGLEDTAHYRYNPLAALNEVGCDGDVVAGEDICKWLDGIGAAHPDALLATSTHDTKRSEDARHRLYALADRPQAWIEFFERAQEIAAPHAKGFTLRPAYEYLLYQSLVATWPVEGKIDDTYVERIKAFGEKSAREGRLDTQWFEPDAAYEKGLSGFIESVLRDDRFAAHFTAFAREIDPLGALYSLSALTLKILGPAVPDIYQGQEHWDYSLVDPDNRRTVDYASHRAALDEIDDYDGSQANAKLWLTQKLLDIRKDFLLAGAPRVTEVPLAGKDAQSLLAWRIGVEGEKALTVVCPRYPGRLADGFRLTAEARLDEGADGQSYKDLLRGEHLPGKGADVGRLLSRFPVAVICGI